MADQDLDSLAEDIKRHGQREKGVVLDGMVLDGWHRFLACQQVGVEFGFTEFRGNDPVEFVLSKNLHRRHLTASQRAMSIVAATNWRPAGVNSSSAAAAEDTETAKSLAEKAEVSQRTIEHAKTAHRAGLGQAVLEGKVSAETAAKVAKLPKAKREKAKRDIEEGREPPLPKVVAASKEVERLYGEVKEKLVEVMEQRDELADTARELEDRLTAFEKTEPDEQQKEIMRLQQRVRKLEGEVERLTRARNDAQAKCNELIREVKRLRKK
jgi:chromosome segregation ATPase